MAEGMDWIEQCTSEAQKLHPLVTEVVTDQMVELLNDRLCERPLHSSDLNAIGKDLIAGMVPKKTEETHED